MELGDVPSPDRRGNDRDENRERIPRRPSRSLSAPGRRKTDYDPRTTVTNKTVASIVAVINVLVLVGEAILYGPCNGPF